MHHRTLILFACVAIYYTLATYALVSFDAGLLVTAVVLFGGPAALLAHFTLAPSAVVIAVGVFGLGLAVILEGVAHLYGLWYSLGITELRLFGILPLEMIGALGLQVVFFALLYEAFFDDGVYTVRSSYERGVFFLAFLVGVLGLFAIHQLFAIHTYLPFAYLWLVISLIGSALTMLILNRRTSIFFFDRIFDFTLMAMFPSGLALYVALVNVHKIFALPSAYIATVPLFGFAVPVEALLVTAALPFLVAVCYEVYLDDRQ